MQIAYLPANFIRYLPVAACYIIAMMCSYYGVRYIEESISDPIENTSCAVVPVLCAVFLHQELSIKSIIAIIIIVIGILGVVIFDSDGKANRTRVYGKKLALIGIAMPFCYMIFDAVGTFLDIYYTTDAKTSVLVGVTESNLANTANCCFEFTFLLVAIGILIFLKIKNVRLFNTEEDEALISAGNQPENTLSAEEMAKYKREHWRIENNLHHVLDDAFREDRSTAKGSKNNLSVIRKIAYNILRIVIIRDHPGWGMQRMMDYFSTHLELTEKMLFSPIPSFY